METESNDKVHWWLLRDISSRLSSVFECDRLNAEGIEAFTPFRKELRHGGNSSENYEARTPLINFVYVKATKAMVLDMVARHRYLQITYLSGRTAESSMIVVPDEDIEPFLAAVRMQKEPKYILPKELKKDSVGKKIEIVAGPLKGYVCHLMKQSGRSSAKREALFTLCKSLHTIVDIGVDDYKLL